jgi:hypothetical protein
LKSLWNLPAICIYVGNNPFRYEIDVTAVDLIHCFWLYPGLCTGRRPQGTGPHADSPVHAGYCGARLYAKLDASGSSVISTSIKDANGQAVGWDTSWVKLGVYNDTLLAFDKNGVYVNRDGQWHAVFNRPFAASFYDPKYKKRYPVIPTENIRVFNNTLYFLQEITQQRTANLYSLNLTKDSCATELFARNKLTDNTKKEIMDYWVNEQGLYVSILRLMQEPMMLIEKEGVVKTLVLNNRAMLKQGGQFVIGPSSVSSLGGDTLVLAGSDGLFLMVNNHITPLAYFSNTSQSIKEDGMALQFDFIPRSIARVKPNQFLLSGLWGGLYIVDVTKGAIQSVDDLKKTPPDRDLLGIVQQ